MKNKRTLIIIFLIISIVFLCIVFLFDINTNNDKNNNYIITEEEFLAADTEFKNIDEVIEFLSNLYNSDDVKVVSNDGTICKIKAVLNDGTTYNYIYEIDSHSLNVDDEMLIADNDNVTDK